jgi:hypothetical protein
MKNILEDLKKIVNTGTRKYPVPYKSGNSIRIGRVAIRHTKNNEYVILDCANNQSVCKTFSKFGALAAARLYLDNDSVSRVIYLDTQYQKYKNDIAFYENSIKKTNNVTKKQILETRIEVSHAHLTQAALQLEKIIF